jgi:hypothetical protein
MIGNNSILKIKEIAGQLGETFLAKDMAGIVTQQREIELENEAMKNFEPNGSLFLKARTNS